MANIDILKEETVRKQWLISFFIYSAISALSTLISISAILILIRKASFTEAETTDIASKLVDLTLSFLVLIPWFWITYHCAYKKRGTAWLMWTLILLPAGVLINGIMRGTWNQFAEGPFLAKSIALMSLGIAVYYWINCLRLKRVNLDREYQRVLALKEKSRTDM